MVPDELFGGWALHFEDAVDGGADAGDGDVDVAGGAVGDAADDDDGVEGVDGAVQVLLA